LIRLAENSGVELKMHGKDYLGRCPFHDDKTPSLVISPESNLGINGVRDH
jgi:DNA primase